MKPVRNVAAFFVFTFACIFCLTNMTRPSTDPLSFHFEGDGSIPNSKYPLLVYKKAFSERGSKGAEWLERTFKENGWYNSWRWGVYPFHHYHSNTHEVLGVFEGSAALLMGGENGRKLTVEAGDVIVIPAGVGHKCLSRSDDFTVVGAYPDGKSPDLKKGEKGEYEQAVKSIAGIPMPATDPLLGKNAGLVKSWK